MSFQAKLKQFETIQQLWSNSTHFPPFHLRFAGRDPIIGQAPNNQNEGKLPIVKILFLLESKCDIFKVFIY
jgi:hypothetical protein